MPEYAFHLAWEKLSTSVLSYLLSFNHSKKLSFAVIKRQRVRFSYCHAQSKFVVVTHFVSILLKYFMSLCVPVLSLVLQLQPLETRIISLLSAVCSGVLCWYYSNADSPCDQTVASFHWVGYQKAYFLSCGNENELSWIPHSYRLPGTSCTPCVSWPPAVSLSPWLSSEGQGDSEERKIVVHRINIFELEC